MQKKILYDKEGRDAVKRGVDKICNAVKVTLGANGRNVMLSVCYPTQNGGLHRAPLHVTKDGVTVAQSISLSDDIEDIGATLVKQATRKTAETSGDGTTTCAVLTQAIVEGGLKLVDEGHNPMQIRAGIEVAVAKVMDILRAMAASVGNDVEKIRQVATVSANNDTWIGNLIAEAYSKIGATGDISIEESKTTKTEVKVVDGFKFDRGYVSPYFITNGAKNECELIKPLILLYDKKLSAIDPMKNIIDIVARDQRSLLIICDDMDGEALATFTMNSVRGTLKVCVVRSPNYGDKKREEMEDIALLTGATYLSDEKGISLQKCTIAHLGEADKITIGKGETIIIGAQGHRDPVNDVVNDLKISLTRATGAEKEALESRVARLTGGVAVIYVGAPTEVEMKEKKDRCDDAIRATKAAIAEGYVAGGGSSFVKIMHDRDAKDKSSYSAGKNLIYQCLDAPFKQICRNAGIDPGPQKRGWKFWRRPAPSLIEQVYHGELFAGYNAKTGKIEDLVEAGIIDPVKVLRCALENAASAACSLITSNAIVADTF